MKVKEDSEKVGLKLNIQKTKIMASGPITSWQVDGETEETVTDYFLGCPCSPLCPCQLPSDPEEEAALLLGSSWGPSLGSWLLSSDWGPLSAIPSLICDFHVSLCLAGSLKRAWVVTE